MVKSSHETKTAFKYQPQPTFGNTSKNIEYYLYLRRVYDPCRYVPLFLKEDFNSHDKPHIIFRPVDKFWSTDDKKEWWAHARIAEGEEWSKEQLEAMIKHNAKEMARLSYIESLRSHLREITQV